MSWDVCNMQLVLAKPSTILLASLVWYYSMLMNMCLPGLLLGNVYRAISLLYHSFSVQMRHIVAFSYDAAQEWAPKNQSKPNMDTFEAQVKHR